MFKTGLKQYKFEYPWIDDNAKIQTEIVWVLAKSEDEARSILKRMCTDPELRFIFIGVGDV